VEELSNGLHGIFEGARAVFRICEVFFRFWLLAGVGFMLFSTKHDSLSRNDDKAKIVVGLEEGSVCEEGRDWCIGFL